MKTILRSAVGSMAALAVASQALAQPTTPMAKPAKPGSVFVQCDGQPAGMSGAEAVGMLFLITATAGVVGGLIGAPETADASKKTKAEDGVAACTAAIAQETDEIRRVQLTLARAIHEIEGKNFDAALADTRSIPTVAPTKSQERGFQRSLGLSAMELEAATLVRLGRTREAEEVAMKMAAIAPYDINNLLHVLRYASLTAEMTPAKAAYFDGFVRLHPSVAMSRYAARQWAGDYVGSATDLEALDRLPDVFLKEDGKPVAVFTARRSVAYLMAGDLERSNALAAEARAAVEDLVKSGKALNEAASVSQAEELLDFQAIGRQLAEGRAKEARAAFAARTRWLAPTVPAVALMTEKLRAGAAPAELVGALARDPAQLRAEGLKAEAGAIVEDSRAVEILYGAMRPLLRKGSYSPYTSAVWRTDKSRYILKRDPKATHDGEVVFIYGANGVAGGEALIMHCAVMARMRGKDGFVVFPARKRIDTAVVFFANKGDPGVPPELLVDAEAAIDALSQDMPKPAPR